jgi:mitogen-activated protein kinase kinase
MHDCNSDFIVAFYGAFQNDTGDVIMCMEYMDVGYVHQSPSFY